jgi:hypothetical protein
MKMSIKKYIIKPEKTQKFGALLENIGKHKYIIVNAKTKALKDAFPYLLY